MEQTPQHVLCDCSGVHARIIPGSHNESDRMLNDNLSDEPGGFVENKILEEGGCSAQIISGGGTAHD